MKKVVWLASWYPNDADPFTGDFIQRHAHAVAAFQPIELLFIGKKSSRDGRPGYEGEPTPGLQEHIIYYRDNHQPGKWRGLIAAYRYRKIFLRWFKQYRLQHGSPQLIHVHVAMRAGLLALHAKKRYGIPYVLSEHWSAYFENSVSPVSEKGLLFRFFLKRILRNATLIMPVSENLGAEMQRTAGALPVQVVPNVVDTRYFRLKTVSPPVFRFIHVSSLSRLKNPDAILRAFRSLLATGAVAELVMIGPVKEIDFPAATRVDHVRFTGEISYPEVAEELRLASAFVLFSSRENQPCVILEALCCGLPVVAAATGGIPEVINESNGILIGVGDEDGLLKGMQYVMKNYGQFEAERISKNATNRYSYDVVGKIYSEVYRKF